MSKGSPVSEGSKKGKGPGFKGKHSWCKTTPKPGEKWNKTFEGAKWTWCKHHKCWAQHKSDECHKGKKEAKEVKTPDTSASVAAVSIKDFEEDVSQK